MFRCREPWASARLRKTVQNLLRKCRYCRRREDHEPYGARNGRYGFGNFPREPVAGSPRPRAPPLVIRLTRLGLRIALEPREGIQNASAESCRSAGRSRSSFVSDQQVYPHGLQHQIDSERCRSDLRLCLAAASSWVVGQRKQFPASAVTPLVRRTVRPCAAAASARFGPVTPRGQFLHRSPGVHAATKLFPKALTQCGGPTTGASRSAESTGLGRDS